MLSGPVIVPPPSGTLEASATLERCEASPKNAEAVTEAALTTLPLGPVRLTATLVMLRAPVIVPPASGTLVLSVAFTPLRCEPSPKNAEAVTEAALTTLPLGPAKLTATLVMLSAPVIVPPASGTLEASATLERCEASPKNAEAVTEAALTTLPLGPVRLTATLVMLSAPVMVPPASGTLVLSVAFTPLRCEPSPKKAEAVTEAALTTLPLGPFKLTATLVMLSAPVIVPPARGTLEASVTLDRCEASPKKAEAVTEAALTTLPSGP